MEDSELEYDDTDLISEQPAIPPPQKSVETVAEILQNILKKDLIPKEDLRRTWFHKINDKLKKKYKKAKKELEWMVRKTMLFKDQLDRIDEDLEKMRGQVIADNMSED